jgi:hypothetical protein
VKQEELHSELNEMMKDATPSFVDIKPPELPEPPDPPDINKAIITKWSEHSLSAADGYKYGMSFAAYGNNELTTEVFFKRLANAITEIISNEYQKSAIGSESLKPHFDILKSTMKLIAKEIETKDLPAYEILSIISALQGFIVNYKKEIK